MKNESRRDLLEQFLRENPEDPFNHYALAIEVGKLNPTELVARLETIRHHWPDYLPVYYVLAQGLAELDEVPRACEVLRQGQIKARELQESKVLKELTGFLQLLEAELD